MADQRVAETILTKLYPRYDRYHPEFINAAEMDEQHDLIEAIHFKPSPNIDRAVHAVFLSAIEFRGLGEGERIKRDDLVMVCMTNWPAAATMASCDHT